MKRTYSRHNSQILQNNGVRILQTNPENKIQDFHNKITPRKFFSSKLYPSNYDDYVQQYLG